MVETLLSNSKDWQNGNKKKPYPTICHLQETHFKLKITNGDFWK